MGFYLPVRAHELLLLLTLALAAFDSAAAWYSPSLPNLSLRGRMPTATATSECRSRFGPRPLATPSMSMLPADDSTMEIFSSSSSWLADAVVQATSEAASATASSSPSSWRQYVPLVVSGGVLTDIVLGSPVANKVLGGMRPPVEGESDDGKKDANAGGSSTKKVDPVEQKKKERIDTQAYAQAALDRASNSLSLRKYLDDNKSDQEKMNDMKRIMDQQMEALDSKNRRDIE
jgi:hypothetical protein